MQESSDVLPEQAMECHVQVDLPGECVQDEGSTYKSNSSNKSGYNPPSLNDVFRMIQVALKDPDEDRLSRLIDD